MTPQQVHLKTRKGPVTDRHRKAYLATHANLMKATGLSNKAKLRLAATIKTIREE